MSGTSYETECPYCSGTVFSYSDDKPYEIVDHQCLECGFIAYMVEKRISLKELNELRVCSLGMKPLKKLKKQVR